MTDRPLPKKVLVLASLLALGAALAGCASPDERGESTPGTDTTGGGAGTTADCPTGSDVGGAAGTGATTGATGSGAGADATTTGTGGMGTGATADCPDTGASTGAGGDATSSV